MSKTTDLPCWCGEGKTSCAMFAHPKPHLHCFKCNSQNWDTEVIEEYQMFTNTASVATTDTNTKAGFPKQGELVSLKDRGLHKSTAEKYRVETLTELVLDDTGQPIGKKPTHRAFPYYDLKGNFIAQKVKGLDKRMYWTGRVADSTLFGQNLFSSGGKYLTITEGEEDAMAAYQMLYESYDKVQPSVVSIPNGASAAVRDCKKNWEYINSFDKVIICFDNDEPGRDAASKVADLFPGKSFVMRLEQKDANDYLKQGKAKEFIQAWFSAERLTPEGVIPSSHLWEDMVATEDCINVPYPWQGLQNMLFGMRTGELIIVKAVPKAGKTLLLKELAYHIKSTTEHNVAILFLESTKKQIGLGFCAIEMDKPLGRPDIEFSEEELREAYNKALSDDRFFIFDPKADKSYKNVLEKILHFIKAYNCKFIFLDHITMLTYNEMSSQERQLIDKLVNDLKTLTTEHDVCVFAVIHVNDEGQTRGSRAPGQLCDVMLHLERDKMSPDENVRATLEVYIEENRPVGESGLACKLFYEKDTGRLRELTNANTIEQHIRPEKEVKFDE